MTRCAKPGCARPGAALLQYDYAGRLITLEDARRPFPHEYLLCAECAEGLVLPLGWSLDDRRAEPPLFAPGPPLSIALPEGRSEDAPASPSQVTLVFFGESA
jgi:hypothetical protein